MRDTISREAAIEAFMAATSDGDKAEWCKWVLEQLPSAKQWIPVSERLPEEDENVIVSVHFDVPNQHPNAGWYIDIASQIDGHWVSYSDEYKIAKDYHKVVAWMPLPEPWRGEEG